MCFSRRDSWASTSCSLTVTRHRRHPSSRPAVQPSSRPAVQPSSLPFGQQAQRRRPCGSWLASDCRRRRYLRKLRYSRMPRLGRACQAVHVHPTRAGLAQQAGQGLGRGAGGEHVVDESQVQTFYGTGIEHLKGLVQVAPTRRSLQALLGRGVTGARDALQVAIDPQGFRQPLRQQCRLIESALAQASPCQGYGHQSIRSRQPFGEAVLQRHAQHVRHHTPQGPARLVLEPCDQAVDGKAVVPERLDLLESRAPSMTGPAGQAIEGQGQCTYATSTVQPGQLSFALGTQRIGLLRRLAAQCTKMFIV